MRVSVCLGNTCRCFWPGSMNLNIYYITGESQNKRFIFTCQKYNRKACLISLVLNMSIVYKKDIENIMTLNVSKIILFSSVFDIHYVKKEEDKSHVFLALGIYTFDCKHRLIFTKVLSNTAGLSGKKYKEGYKKPLPIWLRGLFNPCRTVD